MGAPTTFIVPRLVSHCSFQIHINRHRKQITTETNRWLVKQKNLQSDDLRRLHGLNCGLLTAMCYPTASAPHLRVCNDFLTYLFFLDNLSDDMNDLAIAATADTVLSTLRSPDTYQASHIGKMTKDFYNRMVLTASAGTQQRFIETFGLFFQSIQKQAQDRASGAIPNLDSYISLRRDTSGCKPSFALIEYANNLNLPDIVMEHSVIVSLGEAANDLVTWSNDIFSYRVENAKGDTHNMITVVMNELGLELQPAVNFVGRKCKESIDRFVDHRRKIPAWSPSIDEQVQIYVEGLANWIVGSLHWSFATERYFGKKGAEVKANHIVEL
ncbi:isoprenoid synthase domain-containing protein [Favolaschia claudopus]|uniref:Terpene synthase n=1 Tax=Favolaschia claudopus TaxID=2862362 RepID=A0AAW0BL18_9AGAR